MALPVDRLTGTTFATKSSRRFHFLKLVSGKKSYFYLREVSEWGRLQANTRVPTTTLTKRSDPWTFTRMVWLLTSTFSPDKDPWWIPTSEIMRRIAVFIIIPSNRQDGPLCTIKMKRKQIILWRQLGLSEWARCDRHSINQLLVLLNTVLEDLR